MSLFRKIDQVLAALGNPKAMQRTHVDTFTENKINNIKSEKVGESREGQLFISFQELNGYHFMNAVLLSHKNIKTLRGATLIFYSDVQTLEIQSDTQEIESDFSNVSNRWMTQIVFNVDKNEINRINQKTYTKIYFKFKKKELIFDKVD